MLQFIQHVVGLVVLCARAQFNCGPCTQLVHFLTCMGIPCRDSHCENGLVRCCLYSFRDWGFFRAWSSVREPLFFLGSVFVFGSRFLLFGIWAFFLGTRVYFSGFDGRRDQGVFRVLSWSGQGSAQTDTVAEKRKKPDEPLEQISCLACQIDTSEV